MIVIAADWYRDPQAPHLMRYFDGVAWTEHGLDERGAPTCTPVSEAWPPPGPAFATTGPVTAPMPQVRGDLREPWTAGSPGQPQAPEPRKLQVTLSALQRRWLIGLVAVCVALALVVATVNSRTQAQDDVDRLVEELFPTSEPLP